MKLHSIATPCFNKREGGLIHAFDSPHQPVSRSASTVVGTFGSNRKGEPIETYNFPRQIMSNPAALVIRVLLAPIKSKGMRLLAIATPCLENWDGVKD